MKRECLLSRTYTGGPMTFAGVEICYSALANEILREFQTAFFCGDGPGDQTHYHGMCEGIMIMWLLAQNDFDRITAYRAQTRPERHADVLTFTFAHEEEINRMKPEIIARMEATVASAVESVDVGKSPPPPPDSSP